MKGRNTRNAIVAIALMGGMSLFAYGCQFTDGYFHQVTRLQGRVAGKNLKAFGPLQHVRWLRQSYSVEAELTLYKYEWPIERPDKLVGVAHTRSDSSGYFNFGDSVPEGHYFLVITKSELSERFDVEITKKVKPTKSITIDVSPVYPDCKGGHEFVVRS